MTKRQKDGELVEGTIHEKDMLGIRSENVILGELEGEKPSAYRKLHTQRQNSRA